MFPINEAKEQWKTYGGTTEHLEHCHKSRVPEMGYKYKQSMHTPKNVVQKENPRV